MVVPARNAGVLGMVEDVATPVAGSGQLHDISRSGAPRGAELKLTARPIWTRHGLPLGDEQVLVLGIGSPDEDPALPSRNSLKLLRRGRILAPTDDDFLPDSRGRQER